jgi:hypothetical protein
VKVNLFLAIVALMILAVALLKPTLEIILWFSEKRLEVEMRRNKFYKAALVFAKELEKAQAKKPVKPVGGGLEELFVRDN